MLSGIGLELGLILLQPAKPSVKVMVSDRARVEGFNRDSHGLDRALIINILIFYVYVLLIIVSSKQNCYGWGKYHKTIWINRFPSSLGVETLLEPIFSR